MSDYSRPPGFPFRFLGINTRSRPDNMAPDKYPFADNIRALSDTSVGTRPGYIPLFQTAGNNAATITDIKSYTSLVDANNVTTDNSPRFLARDANQNIILDSGAVVYTQNFSNGYGVTMMPFRPGASSSPWMYVAGSNDYQKISAPDANNNVTVFKTGIAEPLFPVNVGIASPRYTTFNYPANNWAAGGTAGAITDGNMFSENAGNAILRDPVVSLRLSVQVAKPFYLPGMVVTVDSNNHYPVEKVFPSAALTSIKSIIYPANNSGNLATTGNCVIVPTIDIYSALGHGAILVLSGGNNTDNCFVSGVTDSGNGSCAIETSAANTYTIPTTITGTPSVVYYASSNSNLTFPGSPIAVTCVNSNMNSGVGTWGQTLGNNSTFASYSPDDYVFVTVKFSDISVVVDVTVLFDTSQSPPTFGVQSLKYVISGNSLRSIVATDDNDTPGNVTVIHFPISALGGSLAYCTGVQVKVTASAAISISIGGFWVGSGFAPDIGDNGAEYNYRIVPRSRTTGIIGNASPPMRYTVAPRRQAVSVVLPVVAAVLPSNDTQVDAWDVYRYGGSLTSYRFIGTGSPNTTFADTYSDSAAQAGRVLESDNFEPWTSVGTPFTFLSGGGVTIGVFGTVIDIVVPSANYWPSQMNKWLPGTLLLVNGSTVFTLRSRPYNISATEWLFFIEETAGDIGASVLTVQEPIIGHQINPFITGPNEQGDFFAWGDPLRPGTISFCKHYNPDSAPSTNNIELAPPSEPLIAGGLIGGLMFIASSRRWWALYPSFQGNSIYTQIERQIGRIPVSQYGTASDGKMLYFWAKDGICATDGGPAVGLTDVDLWNIFPHEGIQGSDPTGPPNLLIAPDYSKASQFRLEVCNGYLYADYIDIRGFRRTLVCELKNLAWSTDSYGDTMAVHYSVQQPESPMVNAPALNALLVMGGASGKVWKEAKLTNDNATPITGTIYTFEFNGGDLRSQPLWGDLYLDAFSPSNLTAQPTVGGNLFGNNTVIAGNNNRQFSQISCNGQTEQKFMGIAVTWINNFNASNMSTVLYAWQPSFEPQPEITKDRIGAWSNSLLRGT